jgi:hypothetical protein
MRIKTIITALSLASALALAAAPARSARVDCEPARCAVQAAIAAECPCTESSNHGRYVSCVAHVVKRLSSERVVPVNCKGKVTRCAARSTCGKPGFVTCHIPTDTCDLTTFTCVGDPTLTCATDLDCGSVCKVKSSEEGCAARGGTAGTESSCCATCQ